MKFVCMRPSMVRKRLSFKILKNPLITGSAVLFIGSAFANFGNYFYHLLMGRMLGPRDYGTLTALISLAYIFSILSSTLNLTVVKFVNRHKVKKDYSWLFSFFSYLTKKFFLFGFLIVLGFVLARGRIVGFLNLPDAFSTTLVGFFMLFSFLGAINDGFLRGLLNFNFLAVNLSFMVTIKVVFGVLLVYWGFSVNGALGAIVLASIFTYLISLFPLGFLKRYKTEKVKIDFRELLFYATPVLIATLGLTSLYTMDIILVKHFFPPFEAGLYACLSVLGKIVFFASSVVTMVMFPLTSEKFENGTCYQGLLNQSLGLVVVVSSTITMIYFLFPQVMIKILYGSSYLAVASSLGLFGIFITLYSLAGVLVNFFLSVREIKAVIIPLVAALVQIILICFFHSSLAEVIKVSISVSALLLGGLLLYYFQYERKHRF